jgi:hypothetical protein
MVDFYERGNTLRLHKSGEFLDQLNNCHLFKKDTTPLS